MIEFLKPPTDNLYKFMCICGLILFLVSATYPFVLAHRLAMAYYDAKRDYDLLDIDREAQEEKGEALKEEIDRQLSEQPIVEAKLSNLEQQIGDGSKLTPKQGSRIAAELEQQRAQLDENRKKVNELRNAAFTASRDVRKKSVELRYKLRVTLREGAAAITVATLGLIGSIAGLALCFFGFNLWSLRVQVYQDAILRKQAEAIEPNDPSKPSR